MGGSDDGNDRLGQISASQLPRRRSWTVTSQPLPTPPLLPPVSRAEKGLQYMLGVCESFGGRRSYCGYRGALETRRDAFDDWHTHTHSHSHSTFNPHRHALTYTYTYTYTYASRRRSGTPNIEHLNFFRSLGRHNLSPLIFFALSVTPHTSIHPFARYPYVSMSTTLHLYPLPCCVRTLMS